jgi:hypothetical protein
MHKPKQRVKFNPRLNLSQVTLSQSYTVFSAKAIERELCLIQSHHIEEPHALGFSFNFTFGLKIKKCWGIELRKFE